MAALVFVHAPAHFPLHPLWHLNAAFLSYILELGLIGLDHDCLLNAVMSC